MDNEQERNEHFQGFAKLLYDELGTLDTLAIQRGGDYTSFDVAAKKLIAQCAYDLVYHALYCNGVDARYWPGKPQQASDYYKRQIAKATNDVPDLTEWPKTASE